MNLDIFALTRKLITKRDVMARNLQVRAFFMPYCQIFNQDIAVACTFEVKPKYPHFNDSLCVDFLVGGVGGNRFLICHQLNKKIIMQSKSTPMGYTPAQLNFINLYLEPAKAAEAAKAIRMLCIAAVESEGDPKHIAEALFLAELLNDVSLSSQS